MFAILRNWFRDGLKYLIFWIFWKDWRFFTEVPVLRTLRNQMAVGWTITLARNRDRWRIGKIFRHVFRRNWSRRGASRNSLHLAGNERPEAFRRSFVIVKSSFNRFREGNHAVEDEPQRDSGILCQSQHQMMTVALISIWHWPVSKGDCAFW